MIIIQLTVSLNMKCFLLVIIALACGNEILAQEFEKAPVPKVKKIVEWVQKNGNKKVQKGITYNFDNNGNLIHYNSDSENDFTQFGEFEYDTKNRLIKARKTSGMTSSITEIIYNEKQKIEFFYFRTNTYKTVYYSDDENKLLEKKAFINNSMSDDKYELFDRAIYNYNSNDSLVGVKVYKYQQGSKKPTIYKTVYQHHPTSGKLMMTKHFDFDGSLIDSIAYRYDKMNRLIQKKKIIPNLQETTNIFQYQNGQLWIEAYIDEEMTETKIYKNGRLIRKRSKWNNGEEQVIDFQYVFL